jgi:hypothetical protein
VNSEHIDDKVRELFQDIDSKTKRMNNMNFFDCDVVINNYITTEELPSQN